MYCILVRANYPEVKNIECKHFIAEKDSDDINNCYAVVLSPERIQMEERAILDYYLPSIAEEKDFKANDCKWSEADLVGEYEY
jgi:hypothetical protein